MESNVIVLTPNGRRQNVKVTPNTTIIKILEEACAKHGFPSDEYGLKHHKRIISLSEMFRFSGLPNNCLLEMFLTDKKRIVQPVDICVQTEDGVRKQGQFIPGDTIWDVLKQLLGEEELQKFKSPVVLYMRQEIFGAEQLKATTLKSLGILQSRALLRLVDKQLDELKTQAMVYKQPVPKTCATNDEVETKKPKSGKSIVPGGSGFAITKDLVQSLKQSSRIESTDSNNESSGHDEEPSCSNKNNENSQPEKPKYDWGVSAGRSLQTSEKKIEQDEKENESLETIIEPEYQILGERSAIIYSLDSTHTQIEDLPDSFYDLTVNDLKLVLRDLNKITSPNEDAPLLTAKQRDIAENTAMLKKIAQYKNCVIRIQFPDRHVLQGMFKPIEKLTDILKFVTTYLEKPDEPFYLFTIPPKTKLDSDKTLLEYGFVPNALLHFSFEDVNQNVNQFIKTEYLNQLTTAEGAYYAASKLRKEQNRSHNQHQSRPVNASTGAIPKRPRNDNANNEN